MTALLRLSVGNQFGMDPEEIKSILREAHPAVRVTASSSFPARRKDRGRIRRELDKVDRFLAELEAECGWRPEVLEYGPGLPVQYFEGRGRSGP